MASLIRLSPNSEIRRMQREIDRLFNDLIPVSGSSSDTAAVWSPRVDLSETDDAYLIRVDLPGIDKNDITINFHEGTLTVSGERKAEAKKEGTNYVRIERSTGHFHRSFNLPTAIQSNKIDASYKDGVLDINVPKAEEVKPVRINVG